MADTADAADSIRPRSVRLSLFERWMAAALPGQRIAYHRGDLARDKLYDPDLAALADRLLKLSNGRFDVVSECGHVRDEIVGTRQIELLTRREGGETVYLVERRAG